MRQLTKRKTITFSEMQLDTLNILQNYGVNQLQEDFGKFIVLFHWKINKKKNLVWVKKI